jgi:hypothetical protein
MAFKSTISIDGGDELNLLHCDYSLRRDTDATGRPSSILYGGTIQCESKLPKTTVCSSGCAIRTKPKRQDHFYKRGDAASLKTLEFEEAYVIQFSESIDTVGSNPMSTHFVISAKKIKMGNAEHENPWPANT